MAWLQSAMALIQLSSLTARPRAKGVTAILCHNMVCCAVLRMGASVQPEIVIL
jgi:hypothetical protein